MAEDAAAAPAEAPKAEETAKPAPKAKAAKPAKAPKAPKVAKPKAEPKPKGPAAHPTYLEMIKEAIVHYKVRIRKMLEVVQYRNRMA